MVNKFATQNKTTIMKKRKFCKHIKSFVNMNVSDANISKIFEIILKIKRNSDIY